MSSKYKHILISGFLLWLFSVVGTTLVALTQQETVARIADNEKRVLLRNLYELLPADRLDNDIAQDSIELSASPLLGTDDPQLAYRARKEQQPVAIIFNAIAPDGYSGNIHLLIGVYEDGSLAGVRAVKHAETPGLGDAIETRKSDWILGFDGKSLDNPVADAWKVKRDGGEFDQITGATITPRAIVNAVRKTLEYYQIHRERLFL
ncbi:MAG: electron transport complex subunit RsxG [Gammaproteobacteria bacterium]|nr:electron transport complex subunit RsxG [Gammaproteobacteria bacterium]